MRITIQNWETYNPRRDVKNPSWFRLSHGIFEDSDFYDFTHTELLAWIYILSQASRKNCATIAVNMQHVERIGRFKIKDFYTAIEKLQSIQCILVDDTRTLRARDADDTSTNATNERTNITNETNTPTGTRPVRLDFDFLYSKYPRKEGKAKGMAACKAQIRSQEEFAALSLAIDRYTAHVKRNATDPKYIKHFSTFMASWRDWLEADTGTVSRTEEEPEWKRLAREQEKRNAAS